jgi:hypothetical protein
MKVNPLAYFQQSEISPDSAMQPILKINTIFHNTVPVSEFIYYLTTLYQLLMLRGNDRRHGPDRKKWRKSIPFK